MEGVSGYAWGAACLAYLYCHLGRASRADYAQLGGCLTLLQSWIYEYFPTFSPLKMRSLTNNMPAALKWHVGTGKKCVLDRDLLSYKRALDEIRAEEVNWLHFEPNPALIHTISLCRGLIY